MKYFWKSGGKPGVLLLCALSGAVAVGGCSRNVATAPVVAAAPDVAAAPLATAGESTDPAATEKSAVEKGAAEKTGAKASRIKWEASLDTALALAKKTQKPVMIDFYATWCGPCKMLDEQIYPAPEVVKEAQNFISVKIDVDQQPALRDKYQAAGLPMIVFLDASGKEIHRQMGIDGEISSFVELMQTARARVAPTAA